MRVITTVYPALSKKLCSFFETARLRSFSSVPSSAEAPPSLPPCPASIIITGRAELFAEAPALSASEMNIFADIADAAIRIAETSRKQEAKNADFLIPYLVKICPPVKIVYALILCAETGKYVEEVTFWDAE